MAGDEDGASLSLRVKLENEPLVVPSTRGMTSTVILSPGLIDR